MNRKAWSRSRFWLCHFLHSRHVRQPIEWGSRTDTDPQFVDAMTPWLNASRYDPHEGGAWLVARAVRDNPYDPAYIQSLRLLVKEQCYQDELIDRTLDRCGSAAAPQRRIVSSAGTRLGRLRRRWLGSRFEMSLLLFGNLLDLMFLTMIGTRCVDAAVTGALKNITTDKRAHILFCMERLTWSYADFQFVRRNLRRLRLRWMWAVMLVHAARRHGPLIRACGSSRIQFVFAGTRRFAGLLESMVPYRREALLSALLAQRRHPFAKPNLP